MLRPPPERTSLDKGALEGEGKEKYLKSLEKKLNHLQGSDKRAITSKDILHSLSESRDDHMRQMTTPTSNTVHSTLHQDLEPARNDPWSANPSSTDTDWHQTTASELHSEMFVDVKLEKTGCGFSKCFSWLTCMCCKGVGGSERLQTSRGSGRQGRLRGSEGSSLREEEEREYLMDCDELGLSWEQEGDGN